VQWHTVDTSTGHTITPDTQPPPNAATLNPGSTTAPQTLSTPGTYHYHCTVHPTMHGTLIVQ
jgi:plastocyanin